MDMPDWLAEALKKGESVHCHVRQSLDDTWKQDDIGGFTTSYIPCFISATDWLVSWRYAEPYTTPACVLKPFQQVLGRDMEEQYWRIDFFDEFDPDSEYPYVCLLNMYRYCIPYDGNERYKGTSNNFVND